MPIRKPLEVAASAVGRHVACLTGIQLHARRHTVMVARIGYVRIPSGRVLSQIICLPVTGRTRNAAIPVTVLAVIICMAGLAVLYIIAHMNAMGLNPGKIVRFRPEHAAGMAGCAVAVVRMTGCAFSGIGASRLDFMNLHPVFVMVPGHDFRFVAGFAGLLEHVHFFLCGRNNVFMALRALLVLRNPLAQRQILVCDDFFVAVLAGDIAVQLMTEINDARRHTENDSVRDGICFIMAAFAYFFGGRNQTILHILCRLSVLVAVFAAVVCDALQSSRMRLMRKICAFLYAVPDQVQTAAAHEQKRRKY